MKNCNVRPLAKHIRLPIKSSTTREDAVFDLIHIDVWGIHSVQTFDKNKIFLTIVDDHSRMTWLYMLKLKSDFVFVLRRFLQLVLTQFNKRVKVIRSDNGIKFMNHEC